MNEEDELIVFDKRKLQVVAVVVCALFLLTMNYYGAFSFDIDRRSPDPEPKAVPEPEPKPQPEPEPEPQTNNSTAKVFVGSLAVIALGSYILIFHPGEAKGHYRKTAKSARKSYKKYKWW